MAPNDFFEKITFSNIKYNNYTQTKYNFKIIKKCILFEIEFYVNFYEPLAEFNSYTGGLGAAILIENNTYSNGFLSDGVQISSGLGTYIVVERQFEFNMAKPYSACDIDNESPSNFKSNLYNMFLNSEYQYSQQACFVQCLQMQLIQKCNCTDSTMLYLFQVDDCSSSIEKVCLRNFTKLTEGDSLNFTGSDKLIDEQCMPLCPLECNATKLIPRVSAYQLTGEKYIEFINANEVLKNDFVTQTVDKTTAKDSMVCVSVFYDTFAYLYTKDTPQMDIVSLLANIGGNLGLFLGVSLFSMWEVIDVLIEVYFIKTQTKVADFLH